MQASGVRGGLITVVHHEREQTISSAIMSEPQTAVAHYAILNSDVASDSLPPSTVLPAFCRISGGLSTVRAVIR